MKLIIALALLTGSVAFAQKAQKFEIDPSHTSVVFKVDHLGFTDVYGRFNDVSGVVMMDEKNLKNSKVDLDIKAASVDTGVKKRDEHLNSPDFFNTKQFPKITFRSKSIKKVSDNKFEVTGEFNMHGKKNTITIPVEQTRTGKDPWGNTRTGFKSNFSLKRSDYGMSFMQGENQVGDQIDVMIGLEAIQK